MLNAGGLIPVSLLLAALAGCSSRADESSTSPNPAAAPAARAAKDSASKDAVAHSPQALAHRAQAMAFAEQGKLDKALRHFHAALKLQPNDAALYSDLGVALVSGGLTETALDYFRRALELSPGQPVAANNLAWILATHPDAEVRDGREALRLAQELCKQGQPDVQRLDTLAAAYAELGRYDEAAKTATQAVELANRTGGGGEIALRQQTYAAGRPYRSDFVAATGARSPQAPRPAPESEIVRSVQHYVATLPREGEKWDTAIRVAWVLATHPDRRLRDGALALQITKPLCDATQGRRANYLACHAAALADNGRFDEAAKVCRQALALPDITSAWRSQITDNAALYANSQPVRDSAAAVAELPEEGQGGLGWKMAAIHLGLAQVCEADGDIPAAVAALQQTLVFSPRYAAAHRRLAALLRSARRPEQAVAHLTTAVQVCPEDMSLRHALGISLAEIGRYDQALQQLNEVRRHDPQGDGLDNDLANVLLRSGRVREAIEHCRAVLKVRPEAQQIANNLAWILATHPDAALRDGAEAVRLAEEVCRQSQRRDAQQLDTLAAAYAELGRYDDAVKTAEEAIGLLGANAVSADAVKALRHRLLEYQARRPARSG